MQRLLLILVFISSINFIIAQELFCEVIITVPDKSKIKTDPKVFKTLENAITEFMNTTKWTSETYSEDEKIECNIFVAITKQTGNSYSGSFTVVSKRPVFNSNYKTTVIKIVDKDILFEYKEFEAIEISENQFITNLSHLLSFYANMIIGIDNETFAEKGGEVYLQKAKDILTLVSSAEGKKYEGWKVVDKNKRSRYWQITNILNPRFDLFRVALYQYHREGLDNFYSEDKLARENIKKALENLAKVSLDDPNSSIMQMWADSKSKETIDLFKGAPEDEKAAIIKILQKVDPVNANKYKEISK